MLIYCSAGSHSQWGIVEIFVTGSGGLFAADGLDSLGLRARGGAIREHPAKTWLVGDTPSPAREPGTRARWEFKCDRCGDSVVCRDDRLRPIVSKLRDERVSEISLSGLRVAMG